MKGQALVLFLGLTASFIFAEVMWLAVTWGVNTVFDWSVPYSTVAYVILVIYGIFILGYLLLMGLVVGGVFSFAWISEWKGNRKRKKRK